MYLLKKGKDQRYCWSDEERDKLIEEMKEKVLEIMSKIFNVDIQLLSEMTSKKDLQEWDSMSHLNLIVENNIIYISDNFGYLYAYNYQKKNLILYL